MTSITSRKRATLPSAGPIILIASCEAFRHNGYDDACRETWLKQWPDVIDYRFVYGRGAENLCADEVLLDVEDDINSFPSKTQAACAWASENDYGHSFHCCSDTYVNIPNLLLSGFEAFDYSGYIIGTEERLLTPRWSAGRTFKTPPPTRNVQSAQGGAGYWLSPAARKPVEQTPVPDWTKFAEDVFVGDCVWTAGIPITHSSLYWIWGYRSQAELGGVQGLDGGPFPELKNLATVHLSRYDAMHYKKEWMYDIHSRTVRGLR